MSEPSEAPGAESLTLRFHGHACWTLHHSGGEQLLIDPYESGALGGSVALEPLPDTDAWVVRTHEHVDHDGWRSLPSARLLPSNAQTPSFRIDYRVAGHDELGGRLRGGSVRLLEIRSAGLRILHCSDLGERPEGDLLAWMRRDPVDAMIVPVGGFYTLGADGAAELVARVRPRWALPCHSADDGVTLPELAPVADFLRRWPHVEMRNELRLCATVPATPGADLQTHGYGRASRDGGTRVARLRNRGQRKGPR